MEKAKVIARYLDGRLAKGFTHGFNPNKPSFFLNPMDDQSRVIQVNLKDLKAVFFVKSFEGNPDYDKSKTIAEAGSSSGRKCEVVFQDNETILGTTLGYSSERTGFFLFPLDPNGNNDRIFVISAAMKSFRYV